MNYSQVEEFIFTTKIKEHARTVIQYTDKLRVYTSSFGFRKYEPPFSFESVLETCFP